LKVADSESWRENRERGRKKGGEKGGVEPRTKTVDVEGRKRASSRPLRREKFVFSPAKHSTLRKIST